MHSTPVTVNKNTDAIECRLRPKKRQMDSYYRIPAVERKSLECRSGHLLLCHQMLILGVS